MVAECQMQTMTVTEVPILSSIEVTPVDPTVTEGGTLNLTGQSTELIEIEI